MAKSRAEEVGGSDQNDPIAVYQRIVRFWQKEMAEIRKSEKSVPETVLDEYFASRAKQISQHKELIDRFFLYAAKIISIAIPKVEAILDEPGYVRNGKLNIPFFAIGNLPPDSWLDSVAGHADKIKLLHTGSLNLSGSVTLFDSLGYVNDLDFCEYFSPNLEISDLGVALRSLRRDQAPVCVRVNVSPGVNRARTDLEFLSEESIRKMLSVFFKAKFRKFDFISNDDLLSVTELTNVVLPRFTGTRESYLVPGTYAQQEVVVGEHTWIPPTLSHPVVLGGYAAYLADEANHYLEIGNLAKAAKRALCLARIMMLPDEFALIAKAIRGSRVALLDYRDTKKKLLEFLSTVQSTAAVAWQPLLAKSIEAIDAGAESERPTEKAIIINHIQSLLGMLEPPNANVPKELIS